MTHIVVVSFFFLFCSLMQGEGEQKTMSMYWLDLYEPENNRTGSIYMFGKVC